MNCCDACDNLGIPIGPQGNPGSIIGAVATILVPAASILTLNSIPYTLVPAAGAAKAIRLLNWSTSLQYNSATYAANTTLQVYTETATAIQGSDSVVLTSTVSRHLPGTLVFPSGTTSTVLIGNKPLLLNTLTGNPTTGNSDIVIYIGYQIINL